VIAPEPLSEHVVSIGGITAGGRRADSRERQPPAGARPRQLGGQKVSGHLVGTQPAAFGLGFQRDGQISWQVHSQRHDTRINLLSGPCRIMDGKARHRQVKYFPATGRTWITIRTS
jgi:hypothetical protein